MTPHQLEQFRELQTQVSNLRLGIVVTVIALIVALLVVAISSLGRSRD